MEVFIEGLGYEPVLHEKGGVAYDPDLDLDKSCQREVENSDIYVCILGGRYGSESSTSKEHTGGINTADQFANYQSITRSEFEKAVAKDIPIYVLVEKQVQAELLTYQKNRSNKSIAWAHVDNVSIFDFIEQILALKRNNPVQGFERFSDIESWLKEQWSGLFQDLLRRRSVQTQFRALGDQVSDLQDVSSTLKSYMEEVVKRLNVGDAVAIIAEQEKRAAERRVKRKIESNPVVSFLSTEYQLTSEAILDIIQNAKSLNDITKASPSGYSAYVAHLVLDSGFVRELNVVREALGQKPFARIRKLLAG